MSLKLIISHVVFLSVINVMGIETIEPSLKGFDDSVLFKINWPGKEEIDSDILVVPDTQLMTVSTENDEKYLCLIPAVREKEKNFNVKANGPNPLDLLVPLFRQSSCTHRLEAYWTYELCHGRYIRQYHEEREGKMVKLQEYYLGMWDKTKQDQLRKHLEEEATKVTGPAPIKKIDGLKMPYLQVNMSDGTLCELNGKPRVTNVLYICYVHGKHEIYSLKETSICEYEVIVLSPLLCEHPRYRPQESGENVINCLPIGNSPKKPKNLLQLEGESLKIRHQKPHDDKMPGLFAVFSVDKVPGEDVSEIRVQVLDTDTDRDVNSPYPSHPPDLALNTFVTGAECIQGDAGWWKYEFCYGENVVQYHVERDGSKTVINLGNFIKSVHMEWLKANPGKRPSFTTGKKQVSHFYSGGTVCESTGKPRQTEVKLKCAEGNYNRGAVSLYILEPKLCQYVLVVETKIICQLLTRVDEYGIYVPDEAIGFSKSSYKNGYQPAKTQEERRNVLVKDKVKGNSNSEKADAVNNNQVPNN